jgi:hypothetical protein
MKNAIILLMAIFQMGSNINAQSDTAKLKRKILFGLNFTSLKVWQKVPFNTYYFIKSDSYIPAAEIEIYSI